MDCDVIAHSKALLVWFNVTEIVFRRVCIVILLITGQKTFIWTVPGVPERIIKKHSNNFCYLRILQFSFYVSVVILTHGSEKSPKRNSQSVLRKVKKRTEIDIIPDCP